MASSYYYRDYLLLFTKRIFQERDYYWLELISNDRITELKQHIAVARESGVSDDRLVISVEFMNEPLTTKLNKNIINYKIEEVWYEIEEDKLFMYIRPNNEEWYSYAVEDGWIKLDLRILKAIIEARKDYEKWNSP